MTVSPDNSSSETPLMRQFNAVKSQHPDKILFFRMGDFYEMFGDDAIKAAPILGITLTSRSHGSSNPIPLAGVPYHAADKYLARLLSHGEKVVVVEQVEDPKTSQGLVKREIVEILTAGTATIDSPEFESRTLRLAALYENGRNHLGLAVLDISTGSFMVDQGSRDDLIERLRVLEPSEIIFPGSLDGKAFTSGLDGNVQLSPFEDWNFDFKTAERELNDLFGTSTLDGFGVTDRKLAVIAAGAVLRYLRENRRHKLDHINRLTLFDNAERMMLDYSTVRNLELVSSINGGGESGSLLSVVNLCHTAGGSRVLRHSLLQPYRSIARIERRLGSVAELVKNRELCSAVRNLTKSLPDLEKLGGRLGMEKLNPRQANSIRQALKTAGSLADLLKDASSPHLSTLRGSLPDCDDIIERIEKTLTDEPPVVTSNGGIIRRGFSEKLDSINDSIKDARLYIAALQKTERERTGINSLKVGYNKVFGYYLEVTRANAESVPAEYIRKQTLVNAERYITPDLKEKEELISSAEEKIFECEAELFAELIESLSRRIAEILAVSHILSEIDLVSALADLAVQRGYCRPEIFEDSRLIIEGGRHPVIESVLPSGSFVANDSTFRPECSIHIITGPNMSGKSTYLRQIGLIVILAQIGSFVPADTAQIGLVDRVFTRVGALDNLARGQSTFLVEMVETSNILHHATERSLVLLDEVGRGTSTFDGLSIAWAVVEYIDEHTHSRTAFATHYHELTGMAALHDKVTNLQVAVKRWEDKVVFLHQIIPGGCDDSYGIEVARLAGVPRPVISRAKQILRLLESGKFNKSELGQGIRQQKMQPTLFDPPESEIEKKIRAVEPDSMTPRQALDLLREMKDELT